MFRLRKLGVMFILLMGSIAIGTTYITAQNEVPEGEVYVPIVNMWSKFFGGFGGTAIAQYGNVHSGTFVIHENCLQLQMSWDDQIHPVYWYYPVTLDEETGNIYNKHGYHKATVGDTTKAYRSPSSISALRLRDTELAKIKERCGSDDVVIMISNLSDPVPLDPVRPTRRSPATK